MQSRTSWLSSDDILSRDPMNDRFAPPTSDVGDRAPEREPPPGRLVLAVKLLWASLALGIPSLVYEAGRSADGAVASFIGLAVQLAMVAFVAYVNVSIFRGRNWARIVGLLLTLLEVAFLLAAPTLPDAAVIETVCNWIAAALDVAAMVMLFTLPASAWFKPFGPAGPA